MDSMLFLIILGSLTALYTVFGLMASWHVTSQTDYFLAGRSLSISAITATLLASQIGGGMFLGTAQAPFEGLLYALGIVLGFLGLGLGVAARLRKFNVSIVSEIFEVTYQSRTLFFITSILSVLSMAGIIVGQIIAAKSVFVHFVGIENNYIFLGFWSLIIMYTMIGGLHAVVIADKLQIAFIIAIFSGICLYSLWMRPDSFFSTQTATALKMLWATAPLQASGIFNLVAMPFFFSFIEQDLAQRFFSASSQRAAAIAACLASIFLLIFAFVPFYFGVEAQLYFADVIDKQNPLIPVLRSVTSPLFFACGVCGILAAITSTADSLLCAISSILTSTLQRTNIGGTSLAFSRGVTLVTGVTTLIASYFVPQHILGILTSSYELSVSCLLVPLFGSFLLDDLRKNAALLSCLAGFTAFVFFKLPNNPWHTEWHFVITLGVSLLGYIVGHLFDTKRTVNWHIQ